MKYLTDIFAINLPCRLKTSGDWHTSALDWSKPIILESSDSPFGDWGIDINPPCSIPEHEGDIPVANHLRAIADMIYRGRFTVAQGFKNDWLDDDSYDEEFMSHIEELSDSPSWDSINRLMRKEYGKKWVQRNKTGDRYIGK